MGKKTRPGTGGRRTIIQLSPTCPRTTVTVGGNVREEALGSASDDDQEGSSDGHKLIRDETANMRNPAVKTEGLSLLGAYEDSDEEDTDPQPPIVRSQHNQSADVDVLASFMAEIDAITTQPGSEEPASEDPQSPAPAPPRPEPKAQQPDVGLAAAAEQPSPSAEFHYDTQCSLAGVGVDMGDWQEVWDENTGCYYYWNTLTNEVVWELPLDLSAQVQTLRQNYESATVNGNGTALPAEYYPEQNLSTSTLAPKRETKKKEVMESVVALTSEEEERRGVAASLLAPLIPSEVKEAEEKWRKRLLGGLENENSLDSDAGLRLPGSPAVTALHDPDSRKGSRNQSNDNSDAEEVEPEEDTMELEMALERKKAELRALEEGDGSVGGSSPCSEASASQEAPGPKKSRWKTAFIPAAASPDSCSRESDTPDVTETAAHSRALEKTVEEEEEEEEEETDRTEEKTAAKAPPKEEVETPELKFQIGELANTLTSKMEFLGINRKAISNFQLLLLQTEMRIADWREGALNGIYLRRKLQEAAEHIKHYELNAAPKGWSCHWDREHRRYFYTNDRTSASQWDFPEDEEEGDEGHKGNQTPPDPRSASQEEPKPPTVAPSERTTGLSICVPAVPPQSTFWSSSPQQPPLPPDQPPPPSDYPPPPPPPESPPPPPPPPDSDDGEIMEVEMEDEEGEPPAPGTEDDGGLRTSFVSGSASTKTAEPSLSLGKGQKRKASATQPSKAVTIGSSPILYTQTVVAAAPVMSGSPYWSMPMVAPPIPPAEALAPPLPPLPAQPPLPLCQPPSEPLGPKTLPTERSKKPKKEKKSKTKMPSLVQKWQNIQKELDEEEKESSSDEDRDLLNKRSIEEWKQQQLMTGKAVKNANFEALPVDWRERVLKKRKMMKS